MKRAVYFALAVFIVIGGLAFGGYSKGAEICNSAKVRDAACDEKGSRTYNAPVFTIPYRMELKMGLPNTCNEGCLNDLKQLVFTDMFETT